MTPRLNRWIIILVLVIAIPSYWLLFENGTGNAAPKNLNIAQLRMLASQAPGQAPEKIHYEAIARREVMRNLVAAGYGLRAEQLFVFVHMLENPARAPILIGSGLTRQQAKQRDYRRHFSAAQDRVTQMFAQGAGLIPLDQSVAQTGGLELLGTTPAAARIKRDIARQWQRDARREPYAHSRGVVIVPTPGLHPGSRLVFVKLASGREYLFAGSLAPISQSWTDLRAPARLVTDRFRKDDRQEIHSWLMTLKALKRQAPALTIVSGSHIPKKRGLLRYFPTKAADYLVLAIAG